MRWVLFLFLSQFARHGFFITGILSRVAVSRDLNRREEPQSATGEGVARKAIALCLVDAVVVGDRARARGAGMAVDAILRSPNKSQG